MPSWGKDKVQDGKLGLTPDPDNRLQDQILGTIYGNCIGDAIGLMTEFLNKEQATNVRREHYISSDTYFVNGSCMKEKL